MFRTAVTLLSAVLLGCAAGAPGASASNGAPCTSDAPCIIAKRDDDGGYYGFVKKPPAEQTQERQSEPAKEPPTAPQTEPQTEPPKELPEASAVPTDASSNKHPGAGARKLFLWKANKDNKIVYLTGTIHVLSPRFYPIPQDLDRALEQSDVLIVEIANPVQDPVKLQALLKSKANYPSGEKLSKHLSPETRKAFDEYLRWAGENMEMYDEYKPWFIGGIINSLALRREGYKTDLGLDAYFVKKARASGKKILDLETAAFQLEQLAADPEPSQDKQLRLALLDLRNLRSNMQLIENAWKIGDAAAVEQICYESSKDDADLKAVQERLLDRRNQSMATKLDGILKSYDRCFVAVGSAHLVGPQGLPSLLQKRGYSVEQVAEVPVGQLASVKGPTASKLKKLAFPEGQFSIMLPGTPEMTYKDLNGMRFVDYTYPEFHGTHMVSYAILPARVNPAKTSVMFDMLAAQMGKVTGGTVAKQYNISLLGKYPGRRLDLIDVKGDKSLEGRLNLYAVGNKVYVVGGIGKKAWLNSDAFAQYTSSLVVNADSSQRAASGAAAGTRSGSGQYSRFGTSSSSSSSKSSEDFKREFDQRKKEFDRSFKEAQNRARKQHEEFRARHEAQWGRR